MVNSSRLRRHGHAVHHNLRDRVSGRPGETGHLASGGVAEIQTDNGITREPLFLSILRPLARQGDSYTVPETKSVRTIERRSGEDLDARVAESLAF